MQLQLNRGEGRHQVARRLFFANQGAFQTGDYEEIMNKTTCLSLLSNAALVWNTVQMSRIIEQLRANGETITSAELARVSPMAFSHIIPNGTYFARPDSGSYDGIHNGHMNSDRERELPQICDGRREGLKALTVHFPAITPGAPVCPVSYRCASAAIQECR